MAAHLISKLAPTFGANPAFLLILQTIAASISKSKSILDTLYECLVGLGTPLSLTWREKVLNQFWYENGGDRAKFESALIDIKKETEHICFTATMATSYVVINIFRNDGVTKSMILDFSL